MDNEAVVRSVENALKKVIDPEFGVDIVNLGLIYGITYDEEKNAATVKITMTTPTCPYAAQILMEVQNELEKLEEIDEIKVELVWDPPWKPEMMSEEAKTMLGLV